MHKTSRESARREDNRYGDGTHTWWLLDRDAGGADGGMLSLVDIGPGAAVATHRWENAETAFLVLSGDGSFTTAAGEHRAQEGGMLFAPVGAWLGFAAGSDGASLMVVHGGVSSPNELRGETSTDATLVDRAGSPAVWSAPAVEGQAYHDPAMAIHHFSVQWQVNSELRGSTSIAMGRTTFEAGRGAHGLHYHPGGAEFLFLLRGHGVHIDPAGDEIPFGAGEVTFAHARELHGFHNTGDHDACAIFGWLGACSMEQAGYEMPDAVASA